MLRWIEADQNSLPDVLFYSPVSSNDDIDHSLSIIRTWMPSRCVIYMSVSLSRGTFNITCINCIEVEPYFLFFICKCKIFDFDPKKGMCNFLETFNKLWYKEKYWTSFYRYNIAFSFKMIPHSLFSTKTPTPCLNCPSPTSPFQTYLVSNVRGLDQ